MAREHGKPDHPLGQAGASLSPQARAMLMLCGVCAGAQAALAFGGMVAIRSFSLHQARPLAEALFLNAAAVASIFAVVMVRAMAKPSQEKKNSTKGEPENPASSRSETQGEEAKASFVRKTTTLLQSLWLLFAAIAIIFVGWGRLNESTPPFPNTSAAVTAGIIALIAAFGLFILVKIVKYQNRSDLPEGDTLSLWLYNSLWILIAGSLSFLFPVIQFQAGVSIVLWAVSIWTLALCGELVLHAIASFFWTPPPLVLAHRTLRLFLLIALYSRMNPIAGLAHSFEEFFSVDFRASWAIRFIRRAFVPLLLLLVLLFWASTMLVVIGIEEEGYKERFGKLVSSILEPGLHVKWPWPIETIRKFPTRRIMTETIGYEASKKPEDFIWSRPHGLQEYRFVVGNGNELVSIDALIHYRMKDMIKFSFNVQNPISAMTTLAYRIFMKETVVLTLDELLSEDRAQFAHRIRNRLQKEADREGLGFDIIAVNLKSIHPPLDVAPAYQQVVSSFLAKETEILLGKAYKASTLPQAEAEAHTRKSSAQAFAFQRKGEARGRSNRFKRLAEAYRVDPLLFENRRRLEAIRYALDGKGMIIIDDRLFEGEIEQWIDIRGSSAAGPSAERLNKFELENENF